MLYQRPQADRFYVTASQCREANTQCMVCGTSQLQLSLSTASMTLKDFVNKVYTLGLFASCTCSA